MGQYQGMQLHAWSKYESAFSDHFVPVIRREQSSNWYLSISQRIHDLDPMKHIRATWVLEPKMGDCFHEVVVRGILLNTVQLSWWQVYSWDTMPQNTNQQVSNSERHSARMDRMANATHVPAFEPRSGISLVWILVE